MMMFMLEGVHLLRWYLRMREVMDFGTSFLQVGAVLQPSSAVAESFFCTEGEFF